MHADGIVGIGLLKSATLSSLSMVGCDLGDVIMWNLISALPMIKLTYLAGCRNTNMLFIEAACVKSLDFSKSTIYRVLQNTRISPYLVELDMSDSDFGGLESLLNAFATLQIPIALTSLNMARSAFTAVPGKQYSDRIQCI